MQPLFSAPGYSYSSFKNRPWRWQRHSLYSLLPVTLIQDIRVGPNDGKDMWTMFVFVKDMANRVEVWESSLWKFVFTHFTHSLFLRVCTGGRWSDKVESVIVEIGAVGVKVLAKKVVYHTVSRWVVKKTSVRGNMLHQIQHMSRL